MMVRGGRTSQPKEIEKKNEGGVESCVWCRRTNVTTGSINTSDGEKGGKRMEGGITHNSQPLCCKLIDLTSIGFQS